MPSPQFHPILYPDRMSFLLGSPELCVNQSLNVTLPDPVLPKLGLYDISRKPQALQLFI